ncbi:MAG: hypothetical protein ACRDTT_05940, partial [Pseudonocardiaceae bacterium]
MPVSRSRRRSLAAAAISDRCLTAVEYFIVLILKNQPATSTSARRRAGGSALPLPAALPFPWFCRTRVVHTYTGRR